MKKALLYFLFVSIVMNAQINESDTLNLKADLSLTGFWQSGNVETLIFRAKSSVSFKPWKKAVFKTQNSYVYQEFGKTKADEDILSLNFLYFNPKKKLYPLLLGFISTNFRREIKLRYLFGGGVSYNLIRKKENWLKLSLTSEYERTNFNNFNFNYSEYDGSKSINTFRTTIWTKGRYTLFKKKLIFTHENYFQPSLEKNNNYRWQADFGLELPVWSFLNFKVNYLHTYESIVIENQKQEDKFLTFGITLKSYK